MLVDPGDRVEATQVLARTKLPGDFRIVPVGRILGITASDVEASLTVALGANVHRGDVIAKRGGLLGPSVTSPIDGVVTATGGGRVLIEANPQPFELYAHISGTVVSVERDQVICIETAGALIQGHWDSGMEGVGVLKRVTRRPTEPLQTTTVDPSCHGHVLVAGTTLGEEPLTRAREVDVRGLITGGLAPELIPVVQQLPFPVLVTDGFGEVAMMEPIFSLLADYEGREVSISSGARSTSYRGRPEIIIPVLNREPPPERRTKGQELVPGTQVRAVRAPYLGMVGTVLDIPPHAMRLETGARVRCAKVGFGADESVYLPLVNLDVIR